MDKQKLGTCGIQIFSVVEDKLGNILYIVE